MKTEQELQFQQYKAQFQKMQQQKLDKELSDDDLEKVAGGIGSDQVKINSGASSTGDIFQAARD